MEQSVTFAQLAWFVGGILVVFGWIWASLRTKASSSSQTRSWEKYDELAKAFGDYKVHVATTYATTTQIAEVETRVIKHMDEKFRDLKDLIRGGQSR